MLQKPVYQISLKPINAFQRQSVDEIIIALSNLVLEVKIGSYFMVPPLKCTVQISPTTV